MTEGHRSGRHFLQIPGPTNVPERILRAIDRPDHRPSRAGVRAARAARSWTAIRPIFKTEGPVVIYPGLGHRRLGGGAGQHALAGRPRADGRDRPFREPLVRRWPGASGSRSSCWTATGATASIPSGSRRRSPPTAATRSRRSAWSTTRPRPGSPRGSPRCGARSIGPGHPALLMVDTISSLASIDYRHDEWGVDVTVAGSQKGLMLPPGLSFNAREREGAGGGARRRGCRGPTGTGSRCCEPTPRACFRTRRRPICSTACARRSRCCTRRGWTGSSRATTATPRRRGGRSGLGARGALSGPARVLELADRGADAGGRRCRRAAPADPRELRPVARQRPRQARRAGVPDRPSRRFQRPDAGRHARRHRDGPAPLRPPRATRSGVVAALDHLAAAPRRRRDRASAA